MDEGQFADEAADTLNLDAVENDQREYGQCHAQRRVRIGGRYSAERNVVITGDHDRQLRDPVDRNQVDRVHEEHPGEDGQCQRSNHGATAMEAVPDAAVDEFDEHFNEVLQRTRLTGSRLFAAMRKMRTKIRPNATDQPRVSTWKAQKPISFASAAECAKPQLPSGK